MWDFTATETIWTPSDFQNYGSQVIISFDASQDQLLQFARKYYAQGFPLKEMLLEATWGFYRPPKLDYLEFDDDGLFTFLDELVRTYPWDNIARQIQYRQGGETIRSVIFDVYAPGNIVATVHMGNGSSMDPFFNPQELQRIVNDTIHEYLVPHLRDAMKERGRQDAQMFLQTLTPR